MRIKEMLGQHRRDFDAVFICEHCNAEEVIRDCYDDDNFHRNVIPEMKCSQCGQTAPDDYVPRGTKYLPYEVV